MANGSFITGTSVTLLTAPLTQPFRTALGVHDSLENILFTVTLEGGTKGYGEAAIATHITGETIPETIKNLKAVGRSLTGRDALEYLRISRELHEQLPRNKAAVAAVEGAILDALTRQWKIPLWQFFGNRPKALATDITIVISDLKETESTVKKYYKKGFRAFKVKIGKDEDLDLKRVLAVGRLAPRSAIYLDANQGYTADQTLRFLKRLGRAALRPALIEQPVPKSDWEGLKKISRLSNIPVCADESVQTLSDCVRAIREKAVSVINIKLMKSGIFQALDIILMARSARMKLMIGGMMESSLSMTTSAHLAAGLGCFDFIDLDTPFFIRKGFDKNPFLSPKGVYNLKSVKAGVGVVPRGTRVK